MNNDEILSALSIKYGSIINKWLETNKQTHRLYEFFTIAKRLIDREIEPSLRYNPESLKKTLEKLYPLHNLQITIDDSDEEDNRRDSDSEKVQDHECDNNNNKPESTYVLKVNKLQPSSNYARKTAKERKIISLEYKNKIQDKPQKYDPQEEAIKLNNIKEKLYVKNYLHLDFDKIKKDEKTEQEKYDSDAGPSTKCNLDEKGKFEKIPIQKTKREVKKGRKRNIVESSDDDSDS